MVHEAPDQPARHVQFPVMPWKQKPFTQVAHDVQLGPKYPAAQLVQPDPAHPVAHEQLPAMPWKHTPLRHVEQAAQVGP